MSASPGHKGCETTSLPELEGGWKAQLLDGRGKSTAEV
jgi:hypothetical protein